MKPRRLTEEQIMGLLREQEVGSTTSDVCRRHGVASATFYKWKAKTKTDFGVDVRDRLTRLGLTWPFVGLISQPDMPDVLPCARGLS
ncbi:hypothetical protein AUC71_04450 [Methyloceanibacter marginalis]|uniref:Transposase n=1 Tax=Methyloceanibacter marginalis TaxID=1774971 RepID=A0A1E3VTH6_9HYPH|nr:transposase [Methyloceanibacter marginalis]ODR96824.1 hypothetical protein AUC71_04450 [Methyloceanibacter marginalis]